MERLLGFVQFWNTAFSHLSHVTERGEHEYIKSGYMELGAQMVFSLILTVKAKGSGRKRHLQQVNTWLHSWHHKQGFDSYNQPQGPLLSDWVL